MKKTEVYKIIRIVLMVILVFLAFYSYYQNEIGNVIVYCSSLLMLLVSFKSEKENTSNK